MVRERIPGMLHKVERAVPARMRRLARRMCPDLVTRVHDGALAAAPTSAKEAVIADGPLRGRRFACRLRYEADYIFGTHEPAVTEWLQARLEPGDTMFDVGAHVGYTALIAAQLVGPEGCVVAFEPGADNRDLIFRNLSGNPDLAGRVVLESAAVSDTCGTAPFGGENATGHLADGGRDVATVSLDEYVARTGRRPAVVKLDIEGGETRAFDGMAELLRDVRPHLIVEIHDRSAQERFAQLVVDYGYRTWKEGQSSAQPVLPVWDGRCLYLSVPLGTDRPRTDRAR